MTCPRCGSSIERGRTLCPTCKEPLGAAIALAAAQAAAEARPGEMASHTRTLQMPALKVPARVDPPPAATALHGAEEASVTVKLRPAAESEGLRAPAVPAHVFDEEASVTVRLDAELESIEATRKTAPLPPARAAAAPPTPAKNVANVAPPRSPSRPPAPGARTPERPPTRPDSASAITAPRSGAGGPTAASPREQGARDAAVREGDTLCGRYTVTQVGPRTRFGVLCSVLTVGGGPPGSALVLRADDAVLAEALALGPAIAALAHPAIAQTLDVAVDAGRLVVVSERIEGGHLGEHLARRPPGQAPIPVRNALASVLPLASAMTVAHQGLVHGAFDVDAVYMQPNGRLKIVGFGVGFATARPQHPSASIAVRAAKEDDARGLCRLLHALLTGRPYEAGGALTGVLRPDIGPTLSALLARGLGGPPIGVAALLQGLQEAQRAATAGAAPLATAEAPSAGESDERWMIVKGHLDYGPYSLAQLRREVGEGKLTPDSLVKNVATGARGPVNNFPSLASVVTAHAQLVRERSAAATEAGRLRAARRYKAMRALRTSAVLLLLAGGMTWFLLSRMMSTPEITRSFEGTLTESLPPRVDERPAKRVSVPTSLGAPQPQSDATDTPKKKRRRAANGTAATVSATNGNPSGAAAGTPTTPAASPRPAPEPEGPLAPDEAPAETEVDFADNTDPANAALRDAAKAAVRKSTGLLRPCFDKEARRPSFRGRFNVGFMVSNQGRAYAVRISGSVSPPSLLKCVRSVLGAKSFPKFAGTPLEVGFPFSISN